ncbi:MAG: redox-regulated ATPase YchF [Candidatus Aenigmatarchaeota archaeon]|nr:MAG: redox-regulated ATPase YchF [Candidatus Aenigmarchaeota archaeon]
MIEIGLVGCPSSGKSTFFKAATLKDVKIASYPFTTLEPNEGLGYVKVKCPCQEIGLQEKCKKCLNGVRFVPVKIWDVAGLVPDAHLGRGRGNAFLDDLMQASVLIHILDVSGKTDSEGNPTESFDPSKNIEMLEREIDYWLFGLVKKDWNELRKGKKNFMETFTKRFSGLSIRAGHIENALQTADLNPDEIDKWSEDELMLFVSEMRKQAKPILVFANKIDIPEAKENFEQLKKRYPDIKIIPGSAEAELALREASIHGMINYIPGSSEFAVADESKLTDKQKKALEFLKKFLDEHKNTGVQECLNTAVFDILKMIVVYPVEDEHKYTDKKGNVLPDALLLPAGSTPKDLAYKIHEDIGKHFIAAVDARTHQQISSDYILKNGDIISIRSGR